MQFLKITKIKRRINAICQKKDLGIYIIAHLRFYYNLAMRMNLICSSYTLSNSKVNDSNNMKFKNQLENQQDRKKKKKNKKFNKNDKYL